MDDLTKEFFEKLHEELYGYPYPLTSAEQERSKDCKIGKASISSYRPSYYIRNMLRSRRTSVSSYSASSSKNIDEPKSMRLQQIMSKDTTQLAKQNTTVKSPKEKTPIASVVRLSIEEAIERLTTPRSLPQSDTSSKTKAKHSPRFCPDESIEIQIPSQSTDSQQKSTPTKFLDEPKQATKRRNVSPILHAGKRIRFHLNVDTTGSGPSVASVNDCFRRNETSQQDTDSWAIVGDMLNSLSEKIGTSLVESNQNTRKMFLEFFIEVQNQFSNHQLKQRELYETAIAAARAEAESKEMMTKLMERLKKNVADVIRRDRANKELLAAELAGEVRAAQDRIKRGSGAEVGGGSSESGF